MSNNATSNEADLDWLAQNVHVWPCDPPFGTTLHWDGRKSGDANYISVYSEQNAGRKYTKRQWLARRAELQEKPSWAHAPEWAEYMAQSPNGHWEFFAVKPRAEGWWRHPIAERSSANNASIRGAILGDWRDTLENRPEQSEFEPFVSIEDNQEQDMKQDNKWFERGDLPPVGAVCEFIRSGFKDWKRCEILFMGKVSLVMNTEKVSEQRFALHDIKFRPIRTERDVLIEIISSSLLVTTEQVADAILAAGFKIEAK